MSKQLFFILYFLIATGFFAFTAKRIFSFFRITKKKFYIDRIGERLKATFLVAFAQTKIFRFPVAGILHALVWWGFLIILFGTAEMTIDGLTGSERCFACLGGFYNFMVAAGDIFAAVIILSCAVFMSRRFVIKTQRFSGVEMMKKSKKFDAALALSLILLLMLSLIAMNMGYLKLNPETYAGAYPVSAFLLNAFPLSSNDETVRFLYEASWWTHIGFVFVFLNMLPYSKHFHVLMSVPNVFLSRLEPYAKIENMESVTREVQSLLNPQPEEPQTATTPPPSRFGVKDIEDISWKNLADALTCTECGRCTAVCPANTTGKLLSPRKIMVDTRKRMYGKGPAFAADADFNDGKSLIGDYISREELWACTTCNACVQECPVDIDPVSLIIDLRRYLVMEEANVPVPLTVTFNNIENNGAPWQYSQADRLQWAQGLPFKVPVMAETAAVAKPPEILLWVGCAGAFDERYKKVTRDFANILYLAGVTFAVLGTEESCTGDPARRAGNEFLFQMQALKNIQLLNSYNVKKIVTACPHCFNTLKNEYGDLGGHYEVIHHSEFLHRLIEDKRLKINGNSVNKKQITYHDPCYLGRGNGIYEAPRDILNGMLYDLREMEKNRSRGFCCGAGGGQMFKEAEKGRKEVNIERTEQALAVKPSIIATACPFCMTMMTDGVKHFNKEDEVSVVDIAELIKRQIQS